MNMIWMPHDTPLGTLLLAASEHGLAGAWFEGQAHFDGIAAHWQQDAANVLLQNTARQLDEWFAGQRTTFDLPLAPAGTPFQQAVWRELSRIGFGQTRSYGDIAQALAKPGAARAVGAATGRNPLTIIVPCHRLLGSSGALTGYAGGLVRKRWLLTHEQQDLLSASR